MNEICVLNEDGSNSVYFFDYPVKYVDNSDGKIKDKSNKLYNSKRNNYLYVNEDNDVRTVFPKKIIKHPVITTIGDYEISIGIITDSKYPKKGELVGDSYVLYNEAFGENSAAYYLLLQVYTLLLFLNFLSSQFDFLICAGNKIRMM